MWWVIAAQSGLQGVTPMLAEWRGQLTGHGWSQTCRAWLDVGQTKEIAALSPGAPSRGKARRSSRPGPACRELGPLLGQRCRMAGLLEMGLGCSNWAYKKSRDRPVKVGWLKSKKMCLNLGLGWAWILGPTGWAEMGLGSKEWAWVEGNGLKRCKGAEWAVVSCSFVLNTLRCFGSHFFHECRIDAKLIFSKNRLPYLSNHIWLAF